MAGSNAPVSLLDLWTQVMPRDEIFAEISAQFRHDVSKATMDKLYVKTYPNGTLYTSATKLLSDDKDEFKRKLSFMVGLCVHSPHSHVPNKFITGVIPSGVNAPEYLAFRVSHVAFHISTGECGTLGVQRGGKGHTLSRAACEVVFGKSPRKPSKQSDGRRRAKVNGDEDSSHGSSGEAEEAPDGPSSGKRRGKGASGAGEGSATSKPRLSPNFVKSCLDAVLQAMGPDDILDVLRTRCPESVKECAQSIKAQEKQDRMLMFELGTKLKHAAAFDHTSKLAGYYISGARFKELMDAEASQHAECVDTREAEEPLGEDYTPRRHRGFFGSKAPSGECSEAPDAAAPSAAEAEPDMPVPPLRKISCTHEVDFLGLYRTTQRLDDWKEGTVVYIVAADKILRKLGTLKDKASTFLKCLMDPTGRDKAYKFLFDWAPYDLPQQDEASIFKFQSADITTAIEMYNDWAKDNLITEHKERIYPKVVQRHPGKDIKLIPVYLLCLQCESKALIGHHFPCVDDVAFNGGYVEAMSMFRRVNRKVSSKFTIKAFEATQFPGFAHAPGFLPPCEHNEKLNMKHKR